MSNIDDGGLSWVKEQIAEGNRETQRGLKEVAAAIATRDDNFSKNFRELEKEVNRLANKMELVLNHVERHCEILEPREKESMATRVTILEEHKKSDSAKWTWILGIIGTGGVGVVGLVANEFWKFLTQGPRK